MAQPTPFTAQASHNASDLPWGGHFLLNTVGALPIMTLEQLTDEQRQFWQTAYDFCRDEVEPHAAELDAKKPGLMPSLMKRAAALGLFMAEIPERFGGLETDKVSSLLIAEALTRVGSFAVTHGAHTGIGTLPLVYYGTEDQKRRYLPQLANGTFMAAYALSEQGSGSDALGAKTVARLTPDGKHYVLTGSKQWITNAAWADLFTVFAQVDGDKFTAFLVERQYTGVSMGREEHKLGIRGSSTCQLLLDEVMVPVQNVLGDVGKAHKIAFNILNIGRYKLGVASIGAAKYALTLGTAYAKERRQFGKPIASFGLIRQKLAVSATLIYAGEAMAYRLGGDLDRRLTALKAEDPSQYDAKAIAVIDDFTIEASILKVFGSEALYGIADEMLQVHGGNGYTEDYPLERLLRDARINRIFEGTNEINRLIIPATLLKRALTGKIKLLEFTGQIMGELSDSTKLPQVGEGLLAAECHAAEMAKRAVVYAASYAAQKYMEDLKDKQRILGALADCLMEVYGMDSALTRALQWAAAKAPAAAGSMPAEIHQALAALYCFDARANVFQRLRRVAMMMCEGDELDAFYSHLGTLDQRFRIDCSGLEERVADYLLA